MSFPLCHPVMRPGNGLTVVNQLWPYLKESHLSPGCWLLVPAFLKNHCFKNLPHPILMDQVLDREPQASGLFFG